MGGVNIYVTGDTHGDFIRFGAHCFDAPEGRTIGSNYVMLYEMIEPLDTFLSRDHFRE